MIRRLLIIQFILLASTAAIAVECVGPKESKSVAVYLHGMDSEPPSSQELHNRASLTSISKSLQIGFAIPRAKDKCPDNKLLCWGWDFNDPKIIESAIAAAMSAKSECFPKATSMGLIGFSNGGFVANQIIKNCHKTEFAWLISIGAGGPWKSNTEDLSHCGSLILMAGKKDLYNYEPIKELGRLLKNRGANINVIEYDEGHILPEKDLKNVLKSVLPKNGRGAGT